MNLLKLDNGMMELLEEIYETLKLNVDQNLN